MKNSMARFEQWFQGSIFAKATAPTKDAMHEAWQGALQAAEAEQDATEYPACDTCGTRMDYMPWHYSEGGERHLHACDTCWWNENPATGAAALQAKILINRVVEELENGFVACERCGDQEDTATLDCMSDLKKLKGLLAKPGDGVPDGWKLVPIEPTEEMRESFHRADDRYENGFGEAPDSHWRAMLNHAPDPAKQEGK